MAATVLVVEDSRVVRLLVREILESEGYATLEACDGAAALDCLRAAERRPELVITDLDMPRLGGVALLRAMREDERLSRIPTVVLTGMDDDRALEAAHAAGALAVVMKPFHMEELLSVTAAALPTEATALVDEPTAAALPAPHASRAAA